MASAQVHYEAEKPRLENVTVQSARLVFARPSCQSFPRHTLTPLHSTSISVCLETKAWQNPISVQRSQMFLLCLTSCFGTVRTLLLTAPCFAPLLLHSNFLFSHQLFRKVLKTT